MAATGHGASMRSWVAATIILAGFVVGGVALILWNWPMFWVGVGVVAAGCVFGWAVNMMDDVSEYGGGQSGGDPEPSL